MQKKTFTICGLSSTRAVATHTPELIERLFFDEKNAPLFAEACRHLAQARKIYRMVPAEELKKITDTSHHQGAAAVIEMPPAQSLLTTPPGHALCLNDVENPHNVGAILRTAAFFGVRHIIVSSKSHAAAMTAAAWRVAEGGLTHVSLRVYDTAEEFFTWAEKTGVRTLAAIRPDTKTNRSLGEFLRDKGKSPVVVCLGNEEEGLPAAFVTRCAGRFTIPGSGKIESLNVSVTAALCLEKLASNDK
jgi:RNA methyltransferase, TrmH family